MRAIRCRSRGFTLMELVVAISISGVFVAFVSLFIAAPVDSFLSQSRHAEMLDSAAAAWPQMERDIHDALPNSARALTNGNIRVLEVLLVVDSARYIGAPTGATFNVAGVMRGIAHPFGPTAAGTYYISILGTGAATPYVLGNATTPANRTIRVTSSATAGQDIVAISPTFNFPGGDSPRRRMYLVSGPVTYLCDQTAGTIRRYSGYSIAANQVSRDTAAELNAAGATSVLIARNITACSFSVPAINAFHGQVVTARITATRDGESTLMLHQAAVDMPQ